MRARILAAALVACATPSSTATGIGSSSSSSSSSSATAAASVGHGVPAASGTPGNSAPPAAAIVPGEPLGSPVSNAPTTSSDQVPDADEVIVALRPKLRRCYETAREGGPTGPHVSGMVSVGLRINKAGRVASASVTRRYGIPYSLVDCIVAELKKAVFKPLAEDAVIQVPVRFALPGEE